MMTLEERQAKARAFCQDVDWDSYDYTTQPGADMRFPDFSVDEAAAKDIWISKHYNKVSNWETCHVADLNLYRSGKERRLMALYGIPVSWPRRDKQEAALLQLIAELDGARAEGGDTWEEAKSSHGLVNDEHYDWLRGRQLGFPKQFNDYDKTMALFAEIERGGKNPAVLAQHGIFDAAHFDWCKAYLERCKDEAWAAHNQQLAEVNKKLAEQFEANKVAVADQLGPVRGVSLEDWAMANVKIMQATPVATILSTLGIDQATWDAVNAEWNARLANDKTMTVATVYGNAFAGMVKSKFG